MIIEVTAINPEWIKTLPNGGGRSALARVRVNDEGPFTLKLYAYPGSPADVILGNVAAGADVLKRCRSTRLRGASRSYAARSRMWPRS